MNFFLRSATLVCLTVPLWAGDFGPKDSTSPGSETPTAVNPNSGPAAINLPVPGPTTVQSESIPSGSILINHPATDTSMDKVDQQILDLKTKLQSPHLSRKKRAALTQQLTDLQTKKLSIPAPSPTAANP